VERERYRGTGLHASLELSQAPHAADEVDSAVSAGVADAGKLMPPKSTWFEPKLADGLLTHVLD